MTQTHVGQVRVRPPRVRAATPWSGWSGTRWSQSCLSLISLAAAIYVDVLGFAVRFERSDPNFVYLSLGDAQLMLEADHDSAWRTGGLGAPRGRGINLQIEVADAAALRDAVLTAGHRLFRDLVESRYAVDDGEEGQREFLVQDPDGYLLRFAEPTP